MRRIVHKLTLPALLAASFPASATDKDVVVLTTGNQLAGEVVEMKRGQLSFSIDGAGTVDIDWGNVVSLQSAQGLDVELSSGERLSGTIVAAPGGRLELATPAGPKSFARDSVVRITPIVAGSFRERTDGFLDLGFDVLSANDEIDLTLNAEARHQSRHYLTYAAVSSLVRRRDEQTSQRRNHLELGTRRLLRDRWFALGQLEAEEDFELGLDSRYVISGAFGRTLVQTNLTTLAGFAGLDYVLEDYGSVSGSDDYAELLASIEWDWFEIGGNTEVLTEATAHFSLERSRTRLELTASLHRDLVRNFYWSLNLYESYDSDPPEGLEKSDLGVSLTLGTTF
jgi:putative salt-induced outer membrane protein YdiY